MSFGRPFTITTNKRAGENMHTQESARFTEDEARDISAALARATSYARETAESLDAEAVRKPGETGLLLAQAATAYATEADRLAKLHAKLLALLVEGRVLP